MKTKTTPADIIGVSSPFTIYPIEYSYTGHAKIDTIPRWNRFIKGNNIPAFSKEDFIKQMKIYQKQYDQIYVVLSYDQGYEHEIRTYLDSHYSVTSIKNFTSGITVRSYKNRLRSKNYLLIIMNNSLAISIIVPTLNEFGNIPSLLKRIHKSLNC